MAIQVTDEDLGVTSGCLLAVGLFVVILAATVLNWWILVGLSLIAAAWGMARRQEGAACINGFGTKVLGRVTTSRGIVFTKWICLMLPILPVQSYDVL